MRPHSRLSAYFDAVDAALSTLPDARVERYEVEFLTAQRANLRLRVRLDNGRLLEVSEAMAVVDDSLRHLDYRYHCQGPDAALLFRYDSTPHFPDLPGFPEHKHLPERTIPAPRPALPQVIQEAAVGGLGAPHTPPANG